MKQFFGITLYCVFFIFYSTQALAQIPVTDRPTLTNSASRLFAVLEQTTKPGYIYVGRANSCRSGGCSIDAGDEAIEFEYFDYFFVIC